MMCFIIHFNITKWVITWSFFGLSSLTGVIMDTLCQSEYTWWLPFIKNTFIYKETDLQQYMIQTLVGSGYRSLKMYVNLCINDVSSVTV